MVRVTSAFWVSAFVRRCYAEGAAAVVVRRGAEEAGAIMVIVDRLDGTLDLYSPAPQSEIVQDGSSDRLFERVLECATAEALRERTDRELRFDPDIWIIEVEDRDGRVVVNSA
ncbi:MAG: DUF1491 family protein [Bauldia sp.]|nr:MAG: DUF1491 family protein [Bauldia sp.]MBZ0228044.1 DUF1491 family protein [Bauldia sp.]